MMPVWLDTLGYVICFRLAALRVYRKWPVGWLENLWTGIWYRYRCPYPTIKDHSARACNEAGCCGCSNADRYGCHVGSAQGSGK